jgi:hypothetical protein
MTAQASRRVTVDHPLSSNEFVIAEANVKIALEGSKIMGSSYADSTVRLYEDFLLFFKEESDTEPWLSILVAQISSLKPLRDDVKLRIMVFETTLKFKFADATTTTHWHALLHPRVMLRKTHPFESYAAPKPCAPEDVAFFNTGDKILSFSSFLTFCSTNRCFVCVLGNGSLAK